MTAQAVSLVWWIVGTLGFGALVAFWFLAPTAAQIVLQAVVKFFGLLLSYRVGCALLAAIAAGLIVDHWRHSKDDEVSAQRAALFEAAQKARDQNIAEETREKVWTEIANATAQNAVTDNTVKEFINALPPAPKTGNPYLVGAESCRLRNIAGQTGCGPNGGQGVPKARRTGGSPGDRAKIRLPKIIRTGVGADQ